MNIYEYKYIYIYIYIYAFVGWWAIFWEMVGSGGYIFASAGCWWTYFGLFWVVVDGAGWCWVVVDMF